MADFAPNFTPRLKLTYRVQSVNHSFTWRLPRGTHIAGVGPYVAKQTAFLAALQGLMFNDWTVLTNAFSEEDVDIFLPVATPTQPTGAGDLSARKPENKANFLQFVGRGTAGSKGSFYVYGCVVEVDSAVGGDYRVTTLENSAISGSVGILTETGDPLVAIDNSDMRWYSYVNLKANDHYVHKVRNGG